MSDWPIYTGRWTDYSRVDSDSYTLSAELGAYLVGGISTWIAIVGIQFWLVVAFIVHQIRASPGAYDGLHHNHQAQYRNSASPLGAAWAIFKGMIAYKGLKSFPHCYERRTDAYTDRINRRSWPALLLPVLVWSLFTIAGLVSPRFVSRPVYEANEVRALSQNCGIPRWNVDINTSPDLLAMNTQWLNKIATQGLDYSNSCYNKTVSGSLQCSTLPQPRLQYTELRTNVCPFANRCIEPPIIMRTGWLDSHVHFGINAPTQNRVQYMRETTCAPINVTDRLVQTKENGYDISRWSLGNDLTIPDQTQANVTAFSIGRTLGDYVGYTVGAKAYYWKPEVLPNRTNYWLPMADLVVEDADTTLFIIGLNAMQYTERVLDPIFSATTPNKLFPQWYLPDSSVGFMACTHRYQMRQSQGSLMTALSSSSQVQAESLTLGFNTAQIAASWNIMSAEQQSGMFSVVDSLGSAPLRALRKVFGEFSARSNGLEENQWEVELLNWFDISLAMLQHQVIRYATKPIDDLSPYNHLELDFTNGSTPGMAQAMQYMCDNQKLRNIAGYQTFTITPLIVIVVLGVLIMLLSMSQEKLAGWWWKAKARILHRDHPANFRLLQWKLDSVSQLQRLAFQNAGEGRWEQCHKETPAVRGTLELPALAGTTPGHCPSRLSMTTSQSQSPFSPMENKGYFSVRTASGGQASPPY